MRDTENGNDSWNDRDISRENSRESGTETGTSYSGMVDKDFDWNSVNVEGPEIMDGLDGIGIGEDFRGGSRQEKAGTRQGPTKKKPPKPEQPEQPQQKKLTKKQRNRVYSRVAYLFSAMFLSLVGYMVYFNVTKTEEISHNQYNTKMDAQEGYVVRGSIVSSDGEIIAGTNIDEEGNETRVYPEGRLYAHVLGYTTNGKSGLESIYNGDLLTSNSSIIDKVGNEAANRKVKGDSLHVTLSTKMQQAASTALGAYRGAVIVMEPSTGKILAMVSKPDFNPNEMEESWEYLTAEDSKSPLLNRVTQGLYPPGSTFKIVTALEYLKEHPDDYTDYAYNCSGTNAKDDVTIKCYDYIAHGYEDLQTSFANSCNTSFANIGLSLDGNKFRDTCKELLFNGDLPIELAYSESQFKLNSRSSYGEVMTTSIGQGDTLVSPFHMALIVSSVANKGVLMTPYLVDHIENNEGAVVKETKPTQFKQMMTAEQAGLISSYMQSVVEYGTATSLSGRGYTVAGKTGSAEYEVDGNTGEEENFSTHSWFVGFSNVENPDIVVCVIAEDGGTGSSAAVPIAAQIFDTYYYG